MLIVARAQRRALCAALYKNPTLARTLSCGRSAEQLGVKYRTYVGYFTVCTMYVYHLKSEYQSYVAYVALCT